MRKFLSLFAFVAIVFSFAACGGSNEPELGGFQFKVTPLSSKAQVIVTPSKTDSYFFSNYAPANEVANEGGLEKYIGKEWLNHTFDYLVAIGVIRKGVDKYSESMDFDKDYIAYAFYVEELENGYPKVVGEIASTEFKTLPQYHLNGAFTVSATKKVCFASSNLLHVLNEWPYCVSDQYTRYSRTSGSPYDLMEWSMAEFFSNNILSADEWWYLFRLRPNAEQLFAHATIQTNDGDKHGLILLPDNWFLLPEKDKVTTSYQMGIVWNENGMSYMINDASFDGYGQNTFTTDQWKELEYAGAVFLPAAGYISAHTTLDVNQSGWYWSNTKVDETRAYAFCFGPYQINFLPLRLATFASDQENDYSIRNAWEVK